jgi:hypothetical protein
MRRAALLPALAVALFTSTAVAYGSGPETTRFDVTDAYTDTELCGFDVAIVSTQRGTDTVYPVDSARPWDEVIHATTRATLTSPATGRTLVQKGGASLFIDGDAGTFTFRGLPQMFLIPAGGVLARDAGSATFDWDGNVVVLHGPHPLITDGDATVAAICSYLAAA